MVSKKENIIGRKIHNTCFLVNITENYLEDKCHLYEINETGSFIWQQLDVTDNISDIADALMNNISEEEDVAYSEVYNDVAEFISVLEKEGFLEVSDGRN